MTGTKACSKCQQVLPIDQFAINRARRDGHQGKCRACTKTYNADYYRATWYLHNPGRAARRDRVRREIREKFIDHLQGKACADCGETDIVVLDFDHRRDKSMDVSTMVNLGMKWARILEEIEKCDIVCANDHRRRTSVQQGWSKNAAPTTKTA